MQAEQQTTTQTKKATSSKGKKNTKKNEEQQLEATPVVQEQVLEKAPEPQPEPVKEQVLEAPQQVEANVTEEQASSSNELEFSSVLETLNNVSDKLVEISRFFKEKTMTKDERNKFESLNKKFTKSYTQFETGYTEALSRQVSSLEKNVGHKSVAKKIQDKDKVAIHKKLKVQPFLLNFMKLSPGSLVSRAEALTAITNFVKEEKLKNPDIAIEGDKRSFKIVGDLKTLFNGIETHLKEKNALTEAMPTQIKFTQIMKYMTHCFIKE